VTVVVGVDGSGRSHRLDELAAQAGAPVVWITAAAGTPPDLPAQLAAARTAGSLVVVDDAHRLDEPALRELAAAARQGVPMAISRRPTIDRPELAALDEVVAAAGRVEHLGPLDAVAVAELASRLTGRQPSPETVSGILTASAGLAAVAAAIAGPSPSAPPGPAGSAAATQPGRPPAAASRVPPGTLAGAASAALAARVQRRLALLDPAVGALARVLALRLELADAVLAATAGLDLAGLGPAMRTLRDEGLLVPGDDRMIPAVAQAVLADLPPTELRRVHEAAADALVDSGAGPVVAATQLRAARARSAKAGAVYQAAGEALRFTDPAAAVDWFDDAIDAGADPATLAAGRAEATALLGLPVDLDDPKPASDSDSMRLALVDGAVAAHQGRAGRAADALLAAGPAGQLLAVPALLATGRLAEARAALAQPAGGVPLSLRRLAEAALAAGDPAAALPLLIEAAEAIERVPPAVVLPDTPHALGALVAVAAGDTATAEHLLGRAITGRVGGPVTADRHRLLLAWVRLRAGRYDTAVAEIRRLADVPLPGRERLLLAAVAAGVARRSGDIARIRDSWASVEQVLARRAVDLFHTEPLEELAVAAARLRHQQRIAPVLDALDDIVDRLGRPPAWAVTTGWARLQVAVAIEDAATAAQLADRLAAIAAGATQPAGAAESAGAAGLSGPIGARQQAQCVAAGHWAAVLAGRVDADGVLAAAQRLAAVELPWEASRLTGQAAIRTTDPSAARRLLERARELSNPDPTAVAAPAPARSDARLAGLSEREVEVARLVLAGATHRDIGGQLYISPKTVEHHVARIKTKLGATTRAEFVAALRDVLDST
jgi:DNA-binding NarL/FixJ family response regulator